MSDGADGTRGERSAQWSGQPLSRDERFVHTLEAMHSGRLAGLKTSPEALRDAWDYVEGRRTLEEILEDVIVRHTRIPDGPEEFGE